MAKNYKKKYYKKKYYKKTLSKGNIYGKKSAKSQAKQIYALNKKINRIYKETAPEVQICSDNVYAATFTDSQTGDALQQVNFHHQLFENFVLNPSKQYHVDLQGDIMRLRFLNLYGYFGVVNDSSLDGDWAFNTSKRLIEHQPFTAYMRIIVCRMKKGGGRLPGRITQDPNYTQTDTFYDIKPIYGPLIEGVTSQLDIIKNKVIKVNVNNPFKAFKIHLSAKKLGYVYKKPVGAQADGENELAIYYQFLCPYRLKYYNTGTGATCYVGPHCRFTMNYTLGYVDQN